MTYREKAHKLAIVLQQKLTKEEYELLLELMGDYDLDGWLFEALKKLTIAQPFNFQGTKD